MINFFSKKKQKDTEKAPKEVIELPPEEKFKHLCDNFLNKSNIEIVTHNLRSKVSPVKWLYPGYGDYTDHAIVPNKQDKIATEIINEMEFVNEFLQNKRDIDGKYGYFVARIEGNYFVMADNGDKLFSAINENEIGDYDTVVLVKQSRRLFPKIDMDTLTIDLKYIGIFGEVFNKLKSKLSHNFSTLNQEQLNIASLDIPTYTSSSIKIENSIDSYYIFKLAEVLEKVSQSLQSVSDKEIKQVLADSLKRIEKVRDMLHINDRHNRYNRAIENLEKITEQLNEINAAYNNYSATLPA